MVRWSWVWYCCCCHECRSVERVKTGITHTPIWNHTRRYINGIINPDCADCGCWKWNYVPCLVKPSFSGRLHTNNWTVQSPTSLSHSLSIETRKNWTERELKSEKNERMENVMFFCLARSLPRSLLRLPSSVTGRYFGLLRTKDWHHETFFCYFNM